mmetsp:Transcript_106500/g.306144  ORF Transcript_106500/g.306144 Transcript_106500/m.306144 type:complete len:117 (-) Transcript_106500:400-750(-)
MLSVRNALLECFLVLFWGHFIHSRNDIGISSSLCHSQATCSIICWTFILRSINILFGINNFHLNRSGRLCILKWRHRGGGWNLGTSQAAQSFRLKLFHFRYNTTRLSAKFFHFKHG